MKLKDAIKGIDVSTRVALMTTVGGIYFRSVIAVGFLKGHPDILKREVLYANPKGNPPEFEFK